MENTQAASEARARYETLLAYVDDITSTSVAPPANTYSSNVNLSCGLMDRVNEYMSSIILLRYVYNHQKQTPNLRPHR